MTAALRTTAPRIAAVFLLIGTLLYVFPTLLHGDPPITSTRATLEYVQQRPSWRLAHLANILAVLIWAAVLTTQAPAGRSLRRVLTIVFTASVAVYAVYFSVHAFGLPTLAAQYFASGADQAAVLERAESVLVVLGSTAFTAQAMVGGSVALAGVALSQSTDLPRWAGWCGAVTGAGWLLGALLLNFAVIVPFTALTWVWTFALAVLLWRRTGAAQPVGAAA